MSRPWWREPAPAPDEQTRTAARARQAELSKPPGSLGRLETLAIDLAGLQGRERPRLDRLHIAVFAADHGIADEGVSAFPQSVTLEMVHNFVRGGAAISVLARSLGASLEVVDMGTAVDAGPLAGVRPARIGDGTANFRRAAAMDAEQRDEALAAGRAVVADAAAAGAQAFLGGEMGIANTTAATALASTLLGESPEALAGPGTGLDEPGVAHKVRVIRAALDHHGWPDEPLTATAAVGGFEIAALVGACVAAAQHRMPVLVDGFIASVAALCAARLAPSVSPWLIPTHRARDPGHGRILEALGAQPLLELGMRLGEGSGAAVAVPLLRAACDLHGGMATFAEAGVSRA